MSESTLEEFIQIPDDIHQMMHDKMMSDPLIFQELLYQDEISHQKIDPPMWRLKDRMKTVSVALVLCMNIGVDPPDVLKTSPCARQECWLDPHIQQPQKALENIGTILQQQYERWQKRARYKSTLDPTTEEVQRLCSSLRRNAKEDRVLFHYNGHGVPKPTTNGEIWVFNQDYTQYIPLSIYDLQNWMSSPSIYVYDCSCAGQIIKSYKSFAEQRHQDLLNKGLDTSVALAIKNCIQLAACSENQLLPMNPELPADLFTSCLTTPIKTALRWFYYQRKDSLNPNITLEHIDRFCRLPPGKQPDRRTPYGELNWVFTAITDTIAWNVLPRDVFHRLFRQDLMVASLFRNFLLAERIMRSYKCIPISEPRLPPTFHHQMWAAWDNAVEICLLQLVELDENTRYQYRNSEFFSHQLTGFQVWLSLGIYERRPPEQLPIVLQVLLSQVHRFKALELLSCFLDLGPWAVNLALSVGIFPYVLKLLQGVAKDVRPMLVFIWAKILAVDGNCQMDLVKDGGHQYFLRALQDPSHSVETRAMSAFVLAEIIKDSFMSQEVCLQANIIPICLAQLEQHDGEAIVESSPQLRQWLAICLGRMWSNCDEALWKGLRDLVHEKLYDLLEDPFSEVRAAAVYALGEFINNQLEATRVHVADVNQAIGAKLAAMQRHEASHMVRVELVVALQSFIGCYDSGFMEMAQRVDMTSLKHRPATQSLGHDVSLSGDEASPMTSSWHLVMSSSEEEVTSSTENNIRRKSNSCTSSGIYNLIVKNIWESLLELKRDPYPQVAQFAETVYNNVINKALHQKRRKKSMTSTTCLKRVESEGKQQKLRHQQRFIRPIVPSQIQQPITENYVQVKTEFCTKSASIFAQPHCLSGKQKTIERKSLKLSIQETKVKKYIQDYCKIHGSSSDRIELPNTVTQQFETRTLSSPSILKFHSNHHNLYIAESKGKISMWDWQKNLQIFEFKNHDVNIDETMTSSALISDVIMMNQHTADLLLAVATDDGAVRIWSDVSGDDDVTPRLLTAWQTSSQEVGKTFLKWDQNSQKLFSSGKNCVNVWDLSSQIREREIETGDESNISCISYKSSKLLAVGCNDGNVKLFDFRIKYSLQSSLSAHNSKVLCVDYVDHDFLLTASTSGSMKLWDAGQAACTPYTTIRTPSKGPLINVASHEQLPMVACATRDVITLHGFNDEQLTVVKSNEGFLRSRIGKVNYMTFDPLLANLAVGLADCDVTVYSDSLSH